MASNDKLTISCSPHLRSPMDTPWVMKQVLVGLLPATIAAIVLFKMKAAFVIAICVLTAIATEEITTRIRKKESSVNDYSAALTGLLLALILPPATTWYACVLGSAFAILVGKHLFGGLGANVFNPALIGRAFLMAAYPKMLTTFSKPFDVDAISAATPLAVRKFGGTMPALSDLFFGNVSGSIGETSALCLIIGGIYILARKIADWRIPLSLLITTTVVSFVFYMFNPANGSIAFHFLAGGLLLGALFMATDPVTTPVTKLGRYIFGVGCGLVLMIIRYFSGLPEGVMYSILFMNALTPLINRYTQPARYGS